MSNEKKPYDSTIARIAGNIAAGLVGSANFPEDATEDHVVTISVRMAKAIVAALTEPKNV